MSNSQVRESHSGKAGERERTWDASRRRRGDKLSRAAAALSGSASGRVFPREKTVALLEALLEPGDRICLEGNNQEQADFLARALVQVDPRQVHDLHVVQSVLALPEHVERGIARRLDFSFSGPQAGRLTSLLGDGRVSIGAIHTYL